MSLTKFVFKSLWHYRKLNWTVVLGVALSTAILLGALIIGDSVKYSLEQITIQRLGRTSQVIVAGERLFRNQLANELAAKTNLETTSLLRSNGIGILDGGKAQFNQLAVWGVETSLGNFAGHPGSFVLNGNETAINENLARLTGLKIGDEFLLRVTKLNTFPANTPFVSATETSVSFRVVVKNILKANELGDFSLQNNQTAPRNLFLNLEWLNEQMKLKQKANVILVSEGASGSDLIQRLQQCWKLEDMNLSIRENQPLNYTELLSDRVFIEPSVEQFCIDKLAGSHPVFTYFVNNFTVGGKNTPYSFVSTIDTLSDQQMLVNEWLANDLKLNVKDTVGLNYFEVGPLRRLNQKESHFIVAGIFKMEGKMADPNLMPVIPGLSDAGNCRDWKTGVPVDLKKIRPQDEAYWKQYKGAPKAFVSLQTAKKLWGNRFGQSTAIRLEGNNGSSLENTILAGLLPSQVGFDVKNVRSEGLMAAANGVDFGQLFIGLSFFVLIAAFLLAYLLFKLFLQFRKNEMLTLRATGFSVQSIRRIFFAEASILTGIGFLIGIPFGIIYDQLILKAINTIWFDIVRTAIAQIHVQPATLLTGILVMVAIASLTFYQILGRFLKKEVFCLLKIAGNKSIKSGNRSLYTGIALILLSFSVLLLTGSGSGPANPDLFYISGFGLLPGLILLLDFSLRRMAVHESKLHFSYRSLLLKRLSGERKRTLMAVSFLAIGIFMVISTGLYRKDILPDKANPASGTGGYDYFVETTLPVLAEPNSPELKNDAGLPADALITSFHVQPGDDASCLNLNRISRPRIIACNPSLFDQRAAFSFSARAEELDNHHPWLSLNKKLDNEVLPVFADQTVIQWSLGKKVGDTLIYKNEAGEPLRLKLIGGLENSIFQGNVIMAEDFFVKAFPSVSGANLFLIKSTTGSIDATEFRSEWRRYGAEITGTADRLQSFNQIENTYLNIFLMLGALGLLIGTIGLGILIFRITLEQIPEYALLQSVGFRKSNLFHLLLTEKLCLILAAVSIGTIPATLSAFPILLSSQNSSLWIWLPMVSLLVLISGLISIVFATRHALKNNLIYSLSGE